MNLKVTFLLYFIAILCGVVISQSETELEDKQNSTGFDGTNIFNLVHTLNGDKRSLYDNSSFKDESVNEALEKWIWNFQSFKSDETKEPVFSDDDTTLTTSDNPNEDTTTEFTDITETGLPVSEDTTAVDDGSTTEIDEPTATEQTTEEQTTTVTEEQTTTVTEEQTTTVTEETTSTDPPPDCVVKTTHYFLDAENRLTVTWTLVALFEKICEVAYNVKVILTTLNCQTESCPDQTSEIIPATDRTYTFPAKLEYCDVYEYKIIHDWQPNQGTVVEKIDTIYPKIQVSLEEVNDRSLKVSWTFSDNPSCPKKFIVEFWQFETMVFRYDSSVFYEVVSSLEACDSYNITVFPEITDVPSGNYGTTVLYKMSFVFPSEIRNVDAVYVAEGNVISLKWLAPVVGSKCIQTYQITAQSEHDSQNKSTTNTNENIQNVIACDVYTVNFSLKTIDNIDVAGGLPQYVVVPSRAFDAPTLPQVTQVTSNAALFSTSVNQTAQRNFCGIQNVKFICTNIQEELDVVEETKTVLSFTIEGFKAFAEYACTATVSNKPGFGEQSIYSPESEQRQFRTKEGKPDAPVVKILEDTITETSCPFNWSTPKNINGVLRSYEIHIKFLNFLYYSDHCENDFEDTTDVPVYELNNNNYVFNKALPYASYLIQVKASNNDETSDYSTKQECVTLPAPPAAVRNLEILAKPQNLTETYNRTTVINWDLPCLPNSVIKHFEIVSEILNSLHTKITFEVDVGKNQEHFSYSTEDLLPDSQYSISVKAITETGVEGEILTKTFDIEAGLPDLKNFDTTQIFIEPSTKLAKLTIPNSIFDSEVGKIRRILLLLEEIGCEVESRVRIGFNEDHHEPKTWSEAVGEACIPQYQTASLVEETARQKQSGDTFVFTIGTELCETSGYCNGPLTPGKQYLLTMRFFTRKGFADSNYIKIITEKEVPLLLILSLILSVMFVVFVAGFYITYRRTKALRQQSNDAMNDNKDISINEFANFHRTMAANDSEIMRDEYKAIQTFSESLDKTCIASIANEKLNRYSNISPFDYNRVVLNDDELENDYINASYINGYHYPREYIAAQGPKPNTAHDFWRMVLQHKVESIVMLTSLIESDKVKCHEYFPKLNGHIQFDGTKISCKSEEVHSNFIKRIMEVEKDDVKHAVKHYYFTLWPDHGVPSHASGLIEFCKLIRSERRKPDETMIVHCSAGVGRTGAFIALDIVMQRMKQEKKINIFDLVKQLRLQRMKMVQTVDQYIFLYSSGLQLIEAKNHNSQAFQNIALYLTELNIFNRLKTGSSTIKSKESSF